MRASVSSYSAGSRPAQLISQIYPPVVLVVAAPPHIGLVATERRAVEPLIHAPESVYPPRVSRVGVVHDAILEDERAHAWPFAPVRRPVCPYARGERSDERIVLAALQHP